ncbi:hypothetical protein KBB96_09365 [Luteolibacter ambystomatis]|uniref:Uncharacterized protein n=1 Tax=Luteolibacter ambystomatis TaxID=2824561 RepID=A0A975J337_9BACT|nr:hypothetical protein [Luteolibacter ambystomatis]QUE53087.1 hypothetical protein KBB96_09365 [Luteolibacter ambystomatis]
MAFPPEAATAFHDTMLATGWTSKHGHPIRDWRAAFRRYLSVWNQREQQSPPKPQGRGDPRIRHPAPATILEPMEWEKVPGHQ